MSDPTLVARKLTEWRHNGSLFVRECFGAEPDIWQDEVLGHFDDPTNRRIAMCASKGPGKSCVEAWIAWLFLLTRPHPKIIATSLTADNLADGLWSEMAKWQNKSELLKKMFKWNKESIVARQHESTWWMVARQWSRDASPEQQADTMAGKHADYMLFIIDEAGGVPSSVMVAADAALSTGIETRMLIGGNPTNRSGPLYEAVETDARKRWKVVHINGDPDDPKRAKRVNIQWARDLIDQYGREHPYVLVNVFGQFPPSSFNSLLGDKEVQAAMHRKVKRDAYENAQKRIGIDVARFGDDSSVLFPRQGLVAFKPIEMKGARSNEVAGRVLVGKKRWGSEVEIVDGSGGYGSGVVDSLIQAGEAPMEVHFEGKPSDDAFANKRAEMWWRMAEWVKRGGCLPQHTQLAKELTTPTYTMKNGKIMIEPKDMIKKRLGFSPDFADALALTFAIPECAGGPMGLMGGVGKTTTDDDPMA